MRLWFALGVVVACSRVERAPLQKDGTGPAVARGERPAPVLREGAATTDAGGAGAGNGQAGGGALQQGPCEAGDARPGCVVRAMFRDDAQAQADAVVLFERFGIVSDVEPEQDFDGGYRGIIHFVPALPVGPARKHIAWIRSSFEEFAAFFAEQDARAQDAYRWRPTTLRFFRSVRRRTPSAFARDTEVSYNLEGTLLTTRDGVRDTLFHEVFHLNDQARGDWSERALAPAYEKIRTRCGARTSCLAPYAPHDTKVRGGTFYAFQPGNDVREYAAELAVRYFHEESAARRGAAVKPAFKCGPAENREAWGKLVADIFGGVDHTPPCSS